MADTPIDELLIEINAKADNADDAIDKFAENLERLIRSLSSVNTGKLKDIGSGIEDVGNAVKTVKTIDSRSFDNIADKINKLGAINTSQFATVSANLSKMASGLNDISNVSANVTAIGEVAKNIAKLGNKSVENAVTNIPQIATALDGLMQTLSESPKVSKNVIDMTNALANLSSQGSKVGSASRSITKGLNQTSTAAGKAKKSFKGLASMFGRFYANCWLLIRGVKSLGKSVEKSMDYLETLNYFDAAFGQVAENADLSDFKELGYESAEEYYNSFSERAKQLTAKMTGFAINSDGSLSSTGVASLGIDPERLMNSQAMFGQMASSMGVASETALELSNALTMIGADLASVRNMEFEEVWNDMASGLAGMSRTLDKYGVNIRNVNLQQTLTDLGIQANITNLNQQDKALLRTIILLDSTKYAWGDLADTIELPANQLRLLQSNFQNLTRAIGNLFLPVVKTVLPYINGLVVALQRLVTWVGSLMGLDLGKITSSIGGSNENVSDLLDSANEASDALGSAADNAEKLKSATLGIDELNINSPNEDSDTSGTGSTSGIGSLLNDAFYNAVDEYKVAWNEAFDKMQERAQNFADNIEKMFLPVKQIISDFAVGDFFQAGQDVSSLVVSITDFFARAIDSVDWSGIAAKIVDFLAGMNWFELFKSVGKLMWEALKGAFEFSVGVLGETIKIVLPEDFQNKIELISDTLLPKLSYKWEVLKEKLLEVSNFLKNVFLDVWENKITPAMQYLTETVLPLLIETFGNLWNEILVPLGELISDTLLPKIQGLSEIFTILWKNIIVPLAKAIKEILKKAFEGIVEVLNNWIIPVLNDTIKVFQFWWNKVLKPIVDFLYQKFKVAFENTSKTIKGIIEGLQDVFGGLIDFITGVFSKNFEKALNGIKDIVKGVFNGIISIIEGVMNFMIDGLNGFLDHFNGIVTSAGAIIGIDISIPDIPHIEIPRFSTGGVVEDGLFYANHNELIGKFSNGSTVVSNNEQILTGIKNGVREAVSEILAPYLSDIAQNTRETAEKDFSVAIGDREIYKANLRGAKSAGKLLIT